MRLTKDLLTEGYDYGEVGRRERSGELVRIRRGAYTIDAPAARDAGDAHLRLIEATVGQIRTAAVVSHTSAAVVHGLPVWADELRRVHLTRDRVGVEVFAATSICTLLHWSRTRSSTSRGSP